MTSPTKDSWLYMNNSTFIICWIHSSIAANLNVKWWYIFFQSMFVFSKARNSRNIHLPKMAYNPLYPDPYQSLEKMQKKGFSMFLHNTGKWFNPFLLDLVSDYKHLKLFGGIDTVLHHHKELRPMDQNILLQQGLDLGKPHNFCSSSLLHMFRLLYEIDSKHQERCIM